MATIGRKVNKTWKGVKAAFVSFIVFVVAMCFFNQASGYVGENKLAEEFNRELPHTGTSILVFRLLGVAFLLIAVLIIYYKLLKPTQCPHCKKFFALKELDTEEIGSADISVKVETARRDNDGNKVGTQEQYVPGKRITYRRNYECKKCGKETFTTFEEDKATV